MIARNQTLHLVFHMKLQFFQSDFFNEVFRIVVGRAGEILKFCFVLPMLFAQTLNIRRLFRLITSRGLRCNSATRSSSLRNCDYLMRAA